MSRAAKCGGLGETGAGGAGGRGRKESSSRSRPEGSRDEVSEEGGRTRRIGDRHEVYAAGVAERWREGAGS